MVSYIILLQSEFCVNNLKELGLTKAESLGIKIYYLFCNKNILKFDYHTRKSRKTQENIETQRFTDITKDYTVMLLVPLT